MNPLDLVNALLRDDDPVSGEHALKAAAATFERDVHVHDDHSLDLGLCLIDRLWNRAEFGRAAVLARHLAAGWADQPVRHGVLCALAALFDAMPEFGTAMLRLTVAVIDAGGVGADPIVHGVLTGWAEEATGYGYGSGAPIAAFLAGERDADSIIDLASVDQTITRLAESAETYGASDDPQARLKTVELALTLQIEHFGHADRRTFGLVESLVDVAVDTGQHDRCERVLAAYQEAVGAEDPWVQLARFQHALAAFQVNRPGAGAQNFLRKLRVLRANVDTIGTEHLVRSMIEAALALVEPSLNQADNLSISALEALEADDDLARSAPDLACLVFLTRARVARARGTDPREWLDRAAFLVDRLGAHDEVRSIEISCTLAGLLAEESVNATVEYQFEDAAVLAEQAGSLLRLVSARFDALPAARKAAAAPFIAHTALAVGRAGDDDDHAIEVVWNLWRTVREIPSSRPEDIAATQVVVAEALLAAGSVAEARRIFAEALPHLRRRHGSVAPAVRRAVRLRRWSRWYSASADLRRSVLRERMHQTRRRRGGAEPVDDPVEVTATAMSIGRLVNERKRVEFADDWGQAFGRYVTSFLGIVMLLCSVALPGWLYLLLLPFDYRYVILVVGIGVFWLCVLAVWALVTTLQGVARVVLETDRIRVSGQPPISAAEITGVRVRWSGLGGQVGVALADGSHRWLPSPEHYPWLPGNQARFREQYTALQSWAERKGGVNGPVPRIPGRLGWAVFLTVGSGLVLTLCLASRELILPWSPTADQVPVACIALAGAGPAPAVFTKYASDQTGNTETTICQTATTDGADVRLSITRVTTGNIMASSIGWADLRHRIEQRKARASSVDVPGAADAYLIAGPSSVLLGARRANVFIEVQSIEGDGRTRLDESRVRDFAAGVLRQIR